MPQWYLDKPEPRAGDEVYLTAFRDLTTERRYHAGGSGPIPWSRIRMYGQERLGLRGEVLRLFEVVMRDMDDAYLEYGSKKQRDQAAKSKVSQKRKNR